jgi:hypothetical protein
VDVGALRRFDGAGPTPDFAPGLALARFGPVRAPSGRRGRNRGQRTGRECGGPVGAPGPDRVGLVAAVGLAVVGFAAVGLAVGVPDGLAGVGFGAGVPVGFPVPTGAPVGFLGCASDVPIGFAAPTSDPVGLPTGASLPVVSDWVVVGGRENERAGRVSATRGALSFAGRRGRSDRVALAPVRPAVPVGLAAVPLLNPVAAVNSLGGALLEWA